MDENVDLEAGRALPVRTPRGWHVTELHPLPGGYVLRFDTRRQRGGGLITTASACTVDHMAPAGAMPDIRTSDHLQDIGTGDGPRTKPGVLAQHHAAVAAHLERLRALAHRRYELHAGAGTMLDLALAALPKGTRIPTVAAYTMTRGADVAREEVAAALRRGFAISRDPAHRDHPIATVIGGRRIFVRAAHPASIGVADVGHHPLPWRCPDARTLARLQADHRRYRPFDQDERDDCRRMRLAGHPEGPGYLRLRRFFDRLLFASDAGARRYTWIDDGECAAYGAPRLNLSWNPTGMAGYRRVFPMHPQWNAYIDASAAAGWPAGVEAALYGGTWEVRTSQAALRAALVALARRAQACGGRVLVEGECVRVDLGGGPGALVLHARVLRALRRHQRAGILPRRYPEAGGEDRRPVPLERMRCVLGQVDRLAVRDRCIVLPLLPSDEGAEELCAAVVEDLAPLFSRGLDFARVAHWLASVVAHDTFRTLERRYANAPTGR